MDHRRTKVLMALLAMLIVQSVCQPIEEEERQFLLVISLVKVNKKCQTGDLKSAEKVSHIIIIIYNNIVVLILSNLWKTEVDERKFFLQASIAD
jgi:hypothetical protein